MAAARHHSGVAVCVHHHPAYAGGSCAELQLSACRQGVQIDQARM